MRQIKDIPPTQIAYIDETGIDTYLFREHCYAPKGEKVMGYISGKKYRRASIVAGKLGQNILAPLQHEGTMDSKLFEAWFGTRLLLELPSNSVIVMDNAAFHRKKQLIYIAENHGHRILFLPPYSPELNPIENF